MEAKRIDRIAGKRTGPARMAENRREGGWNGRIEGNRTGPKRCERYRSDFEGSASKRIGLAGVEASGLAWNAWNRKRLDCKGTKRQERNELKPKGRRRTK